MLLILQNHNICFCVHIENNYILILDENLLIINLVRSQAAVSDIFLTFSAAFKQKKLKIYLTMILEK